METQNPFQSPQAAIDSEASEKPVLLERDIFWLLFSFRGRIPRSWFWGASILLILLLTAVTAMAAIGSLSVSNGTGNFLPFLNVPLYVLIIWIFLALQVKRWHDHEKSGWWILTALIPVVGVAIQFVELGCLRGTDGPNRFGDDPSDARWNRLRQMRRDLVVVGEAVELDGTDTADEDLAGLVGNTEIKELRLGGTHITDAGLEYCRGLTGLEAVDLSMTEITDKGLESLAGLGDLTMIWLGGTRVSDAGLLRLSVLNKLKHVYAVNSDITADGAKRFSDLLPGCIVHV
jgi:uncharacterized membrane protein YhaH (DUF805 family)